MKLYSDDKNYKLYHGNMLDMAEVIEPNSIDSIVTDPPYELGFMNCKWDNSGIAFQKETWRKCYDALKSGGHMLVFGGSRTFHRIACAIEDAGFEIRDTIMWLYGCLSEDTEILTSNGFRNFHKITKDNVIKVYDIENGIYKWEKPERWNIYSVDSEICYRIKSNDTDQLVSKNHRCLIEQNGKLVFEYAENLNENELIPIVSYDGNDCSVYQTTMATVTKEEYSGIIYCPTVSTGCFVARRNGKVFITGNSGFPKSMNIGLAIDKKNGVDNRTGIRKHGNCGSADRHLFDDDNYKWIDNYEERQAQNEWAGWGTQLKPSYESVIIAQKPYDIEMHLFILILDILNEVIEKCQLNLDVNIVEKLFMLNQAKQNVEENIVPNNVEKQLTKENLLEVMVMLQSILMENTNLNIDLSCLNFLVDLCEQMNKYTIEMKINLITELKILKSLVVQNISENTINIKQMNAHGIMQNVLTVEKFLKEEKMKLNYMNILFAQENVILKEKENNLHPNLNQIIVARKPCEGSIVDNVMKYGVGGINIDECRVPISKDDIDMINAKSSKNPTDNYNRNESKKYGDYALSIATTANEQGRFPANTILTYDDSDYDEVCGGFPYTKSNGGSGEASKKNTLNMYNGGWKKEKNRSHLGGLGDEGSASRYFYCAKASKRDRNEGLDNFEERFQVNAEFRPNHMEKALEGDSGKPYGRYTPVKNFHPCVKPTNLLQYLVRLVTPKGGTVLDPFNGSGSTGKACMYENADRNADYKYIGIELTEEYLPISKARIEFAEKNPIMDYKDETIVKDDEMKDESENTKVSNSTIFDM